MHSYTKGNGASIKSGLRHVKGGVVVCMGVDGQHRPEDISLLSLPYYYHHEFFSLGLFGGLCAHYSTAASYFGLVLFYYDHDRAVPDEWLRNLGERLGRYHYLATYDDYF